MPLRDDRHLREVRDHDHLARGREPDKHVRERDRRGAAHAGVDLVKDQRLAGVGLAEHHLDRQHHAADLAARGDLAQRARREAGARSVEELNTGRAAAPPFRAGQPVDGDLQLGAPHLEKRHLLGDGLRQAGRPRAAHGVEGVRSDDKGLLAAPYLLGGTALQLAAVARGGHDLARLVAATEHVSHARPVRPAQPLERGEARLKPVELLWVKVHLVRVVAKLGGHVPDVDQRALERLRPAGQPPVIARRVLERAHRLAERVAGTVVPGEKLAGARGGGHEGLTVLDARKLRLELLELSLARVDLVDAAQHEGGLVEPLARGASQLPHALQLGGRLVGIHERGAIGLQRVDRRGADPGVEQLHMGLDGEQALMLVLAAEVDRGTHALRELADARHVAVQLNAAASVGAHAAAHHGAVLVVPGKKQPPLDLERRCALAHHTGVGALAHQQLDRGEQRRLAGAGLARQHGEPGRRLDGGIADERDVTRVQLVDHRATRPFFSPRDITCPPARRRRGTRSRRSSACCGRAARGRRGRAARRRARPCRPRGGSAGRRRRSGAWRGARGSSRSPRRRRVR